VEVSIFLVPRPRPSDTNTGASSTVQRSSTLAAIASTDAFGSAASTSFVSRSTRPPYVKILNVDPGCRQPVR
jgi:hypothetical protein